MATFPRLQYFLSYWLNAVDEHSLHSPFYYDLYTSVFKKDNTSPSYPHIEKWRNELLLDKKIIEVQDLGTGAVHAKPSRRICDIAQTSLTPPKFSRFYNRLITHLNAKVILELGTSFGINTLYLSQYQAAKIYTFEGSVSIATIAQRIFNLAGATNIQLVEGNIDKTLRNFLSRSMKIDLALIDANHRYIATKQYFEWLLPYMHSQSVLLIDDIYHSEEMKKAWTEIRRHKLVYGSVDLFHCGLVFFDPSLNKQSVVLQY